MPKLIRRPPRGAARRLRIGDELDEGIPYLDPRRALHAPPYERLAPTLVDARGIQYQDAGGEAPGDGTVAAYARIPLALTRRAARAGIDGAVAFPEPGDRIILAPREGSRPPDAAAPLRAGPFMVDAVVLRGRAAATASVYLVPL